jgi:hypothetical protein
MTKEISDLLARRFIQRRDVKAIQRVLPDGTVIYTPHGRRSGESYSEYFPWDRKSLEAHLDGSSSYGHYLLDQDSKVKLFAFDIDLEKIGFLPIDSDFEKFEPSIPREVWLDRSKTIQRSWMKLQFKTLAHLLMNAIEKELDLQTTAAYTGNKGIHVYGFTGTCSAADAREGAMIVLDSLGRFEAKRGHNFFRDTNNSAETGYQNLSIELFPKQDSLEGKDLGNLMRLPLGKNLKNPADPTFFIDMTSPMGVLAPVSPIHALTQHWLASA